jgi:hypothetical protein
MGLFLVMVRRSLWVLLIGAVGGVTYSYWRDRNIVEPAGPPEWPPLPTPEPIPTPPVAADKPASTGSTATGSETATGTAAPSNAAASFVNALVDAPEARSSDGDAGGWIGPDNDGSCPVSHPIKANDNSGIFHMPDGRFYDRTKAERCYQSAEAALADGYRQAKN